MATRVGIELSPTACRIIEIEGGLPWVQRPPETRILSLDVLPPAGPETKAKLEALRKRPVAAVVWGVPSDHRQVVVANRSYEAMRREALAALASAGIETRGVLSDIAPAAAGKDRSPRRPVVVALAAAAPITAALAPLTNAGIRVQSVLTPAAALTSLARTRRAFGVPGSIEAYVALDQTATCIALVRDGALITARELSWGYVDEVGHVEPRRLDDITNRLADELLEFFGVIGASTSAVSQVCVCGGLPELRSMTARLTQRLDVEVEPLDSLYSIDPDELFERSVDFRERCAELRVAWAAATDWPPAINLLRGRTREAVKKTLARAAVVAGAAAGLGIGWQVQQSAWWRTRSAKLFARAAPTARPSAPAARTTTAPPAAKPPLTTAAKPPGAPVPSSPPPAAKPTPPATPPVTATKAPEPAAPPATATTPPAPPPPVAPPVTATKAPPPVAPPIAATKPTPPVAPPSTATNRPAPASPAATPTKPPAPVTPPVSTTKPQASPAPPATTRSAPVAPPSRQAAIPPPRTEPRPTPTEPLRTVPPPRAEPSVAPPLVRAQPATPPPARQADEPAPPSPPRRATAARPPEIALPFDASLGTILYSPDRKLAIIDGRIIGVGDEVRGAQVTEITPNAVFLRDAQGKLRRLSR